MVTTSMRRSSATEVGITDQAGAPQASSQATSCAGTSSDEVDSGSSACSRQVSDVMVAVSTESVRRVKITTRPAARPSSTRRAGSPTSPSSAAWSATAMVDP